MNIISVLFYEITYAPNNLHAIINSFSYKKNLTSPTIFNFDIL